MAVTDWLYTYNVTSGSSTSTAWQVPLTISNGSYVYPGISNGGAPAPRPQTALEWLDAEIEAMCKLARVTG